MSFTQLGWLESKVISINNGKTLGIYDLIELSDHNLGYNFTQLMACFHFWHLDSNSFHVPFGMITPTLFNIAAITGMKPIGITYSSSTLVPKHPEIVPVPGQYSINTFIKANMRMVLSKLLNMLPSYIVG